MFFKTLSTSILLVSIATQIQAIDEMPIAKAGQCFTTSFYPPKVKKTVKTVATKRIKLSESTVKYDVIPAQYTWVEKRIKISDGKEKIIVIPASYKVVHERILLTEGDKEWKTSLDKNAPKAFNSCIQAAKSSGMDMLTAQNGTCYYEHYKPAKYTTTTQRILASEASQRIESIPATYRSITKKIATTSTTMKLIPIPIKYKKVKEDVTIAPARSEWQKTTCQNRSCNQSEVLCLVEVPRTFKTVTKKVILQQAIAKKVAVKPIYKYIEAEELVTPASTRTISIPATYKNINRTQKTQDEKYFWSTNQYKNASTRITSQCNKLCLVEKEPKYTTVTKKVLLHPATTKRIVTPPKYKTVRIRKVLKEASFKTIVVPSEYEEVRVERERTKGYAKWIPIICESTMTKSLIRKVQQALKFQGFYHSEVDGIWDIESKSAVRAYQKANNLAVTKLSIETMKSLGIQ